MSLHIKKDLSEWRLTLREQPSAKLDLSAVTPGVLKNMSSAQIRKLPLWHGGQPVDLAEFFDVEGQRGSNCMHLVGGHSLYYRLGMAMGEGFIVLHGDSGDETGLGMTGGYLRVLGRSGHFTGAGMTGGRLLINKNCGDFAGARRHGYGEGHGAAMSGGLLAIGGDSGDYAGAGMRLGVMAIKGKAGDYCASDIRAGTIIVLNGIGAMPAIGMTRGTLLLGKRPRTLPAVFNPDGRCELVFFRLLLKTMTHHCPWLHFAGNWDMLMDRHSGDMSISGKGEVLAPVHT